MDRAALDFLHPGSIVLPKYQRYWGHGDVGARVPVAEANSLIRRLHEMR
jgi:hypothetical protein